MPTLTSQEMVASLVNAYCGQNATLRQKHVFEQALFALVRLAKSEQMMEIKANVRKLTGPLVPFVPRQTVKQQAQARLAQMALPGLEEKVGAPSATSRRRK
ncbi:hypothetical protein EDC30_10868 [Paucimonas lemoignei]|uniref:Uncharacterized protein n=1 Tax=Paucimonas lemoignei TaxID=29443 RepID=A0A4R3HVB5_PAULE|nr:hypothetical protein [Paucimonas lemoignei]TCS36005.1 hypothetical protein EDC30_10868 [Paucimonas lemoignei]